VGLMLVGIQVVMMVATAAVVGTLSPSTPPPPEHYLAYWALRCPRPVWSVASVRISLHSRTRLWVSPNLRSLMRPWLFVQEDGTARCCPESGSSRAANAATSGSRAPSGPGFSAASGSSRAVGAATSGSRAPPAAFGGPCGL
jgi:hypothetical protein